MVGIRAIHLIRCSTNVAFRIFLRLHLFHCKIFSKAKYFQMQMILGKKVFFLVFGCLVAFLEMLQQIFYSVWHNVKKEKKKKATPTPPEWTKTHHHRRNPPRNQPRPTANQTPHRNRPKTYPATHRDPLHKTKIQAQNQPNPINFNPLATPNPITDNNITQNQQQSNPNCRSGK